MNVIPMTPISKLNILKGVPLDSTYKDTLDFSSVSDQAAYFASKAKYTYADLEPIRMQNMIRVAVNADNLYDCNYIMFQNSNFGNKWFYAFISKIEFKNPNMSEISFNIDIMQTWQFDYTLKPCYVEREHSLNDTVGDHLLAESVELGDYINETANTTNFFDDYVAVIATAYDPDGQTGGYVGGMFTGLHYVAGLINNSSQVQDLLDFIETAVEANKADAITSTFVMPADFYTTGSTPAIVRHTEQKQRTSVGSYTPRNKKLLTYPYNYLMVNTSEGQSASYRYEYFQGSTCGFVLECAMGCNPEIVLEPIAYNNQQFNLDEALAMSGFPQFGYSIDTFRAWLAQNSNSVYISTATSFLSLIGGMATGNMMAQAGAAVGLATTLSNVISQSIRPNQSRGAQGSNTLVGTREKNFYFYNRHIREDYARAIDAYFDIYGYATNRLKVPYTRTRPSWNYVKTRDSKIVGSIPFEDIERIRQVFDNGVTFWHGDYVGDYTRNNSA